MPYDDIIRDGFTCAFGRFYAQGRVERIDGSRLKTIFLPRLTLEANKLLRDYYGSGFVRGWDQDVVEKAAKNHGAKEVQANQAKADAREEKRASRHERYLANAKKPKFGPSAASPVGQYIIDCEEIESNWPDLAEDMTLAIHATPTPGIYQASFDFGVIEGIMMMSCDESILDRFCAQQEHDDDSDNGDDDEEDSQDENTDEKTAVGSKRKATASKAKATSGRPRGRPPKKAKAAGASKLRKYFLRLKSRDADTGEVHPRAEKGTIKFSGQDLSSFTGEANMGCIGRGVIFTARYSSRANGAIFASSCEGLENLYAHLPASLSPALQLERKMSGLMIEELLTVNTGEPQSTASEP
ncbi:hypothetical protein DL762_008142 [Monosporascus cannonballus]|uniref:Uncharacterized protein n=1 Tax=Monosporascus cannonballus TaxID=155416 RepID=A0ABY0GXB6_9PEZI|nr:hypothetical protein DL762_008142 [Monosporascus cannonballus]